ncbi:polyketide synthase [Xylariomycetidae sp. FL2044]|nr:polyketide synthase [Xylariomycetidae sp. FL2044]
MELMPWPATNTTRKAIVNSFGSGGTNAFVVLESPDSIKKELTAINGHANGNLNGNGHLNGGESLSNGSMAPEVPRLFTVSARSEHSLKHGLEKLARYIESHKDLSLDDLSHTLTSRRSHLPWRSSVFANDLPSLVESLKSKEAAPEKRQGQATNVFVFTGQGAQWAQMGYQLLSTDSEFARSIQRSDKILRDLGAEWSLSEELSRDAKSTGLNDSKLSQPASTAIQIALVDFLASLDVRPKAVVGHSSGEIAAAYAAGAITQDTAIAASYHRSFLSEASKKVASQPGAMMAVGLGEGDVSGYISKLQESKVVVACVNSPSSTTVSGDAPAVAELKKALDADGVFARALKVDTAYHSHHMQLVGGQYLQRLKGLESGDASDRVRFFSSVTGEEKSSGFGPSYWVDNLVSQVKFAGAVELLGKEMGRTPLNFIELGPHRALAGPLRQSLATLQEQGLSFSYIPTLVRGENDCKALMTTGSALFKAGCDLDIGALASLAFSTSSPPKVARDLPPYHWDHTTVHWVESRISREYRYKKHPHHDLLGSKILTSPDGHPSWRMFLGTESLPWLKHHAVDGFVVFPGPGYIAMAIQALKQLNDDRDDDKAVTEGYRLKNVSFKKALSLPNGSGDSSRVEVVLNFKKQAVADTYDFSVLSVPEHGGSWQENCTGTISTVFKPRGEDEVAPNRESELRRQSQLQTLQRAEEASSQVVTHDALYADMMAKGNQFGPTFTMVQSARLSESESVSTVLVPDIAATMPGRFMQPHVIHPALFDALMHVCAHHFQQKAKPGSTMPTFYSELIISADITSRPGDELVAVASLRDTFAYSTYFDVVAFQKGQDGQQVPILTLTNGEFRQVGATQEPEPEGNNHLYKMEWGLDSKSITPDILESIVTPMQCDKIGLTQVDKVKALYAACAYYINASTREIQEKGLTVSDDHRAQLFKWMTSFVKGAECRDLLLDAPAPPEELAPQLEKYGVEGLLVSRLGSQLTSILTGKTDALSLFLQDNLLYEIYHEDESRRANHYLAEYVRRLTFQNKGLRILEIGGGTGGATLHMFQASSPNAEPFCSEYMFTDISAGFFEPVRTKALKDWAHMLSFRTLDLERDPGEQGFETYSYDLVVASNVIHATKSLQTSLGNIHKLLKPGGALAYVELVKETPYHNMTFGLLAGWWLGVGEGRESTPLQSIEQWGQALQKSGFSDVELGVHDFPEPARQAALIKATALPVSLTNGNSVHALPPVSVLSGLPDGSESVFFGNALLSTLEAQGFTANLRQWSDTVVDPSQTYVILDSADRLLFDHASSEQFTKLVELVTKASRIYWITFADGEAKIRPEAALITGFARTARRENKNLQFITLDVQDSVERNQVDILAMLSDFFVSTEAKIAKEESIELETMYRHGKMHIPRFVPDRKLVRAMVPDSQEPDLQETLFHQPTRSLKVHVEKPGRLNTITFIDDEIRELEPDEVEVQSFAWGVSFKDVGVALGQWRSTEKMIGEGSGIITRVGANMTSRHKPGDRVAVLTGTPFASKTITNGNFVHEIPESMSFTEAASIPIPFVAAYYGLVELAGLKRGQTILIHTATGYLGKVAIIVAQHIGATVIATCANASKRQLLMDDYGIPESHIFSYRTTDFAAGVMRLTGGKGADVIVNTLEGKAHKASWECIAKLGTFLEFPKWEIYKRSQLDMEVFDRGARFISVDMFVLADARPEYIQELLRRVFYYIEAGHYSLPPITTLPIGEVKEALEFIQTLGNNNRVILTADSSTKVIARAPQLRLRADRTYVVVGGLGNIGRHVCSHLQKHGARHVTVISRRGHDDTTRAALERELTENVSSVVKVVTCDVTDATAVSQAAIHIRANSPPVAGVIHGAMFVADRTLPQMTLPDLQNAIRPKYDGTKNLSDEFASDNLDFFIMLSSLAGIVGCAAQANYAAANAYQDMFALAQASSGVNNFVALDLPMITETEWTSDQRLARMAREGIEAVSIREVLTLLDYAMAGRAFEDGSHQIGFGLGPQLLLDQVAAGTPIPPLLQTVSGSIRTMGGETQQKQEQSLDELLAQAASTEEAEKIILDAIAKRLSSLTAVDSSEILLDAPLTDLGLDSLIAIEVKSWVGNTLQAPVQVGEIMDSADLRAFASLVTSRSGLVTKNKTGDEANGDDANGTSQLNGIAGDGVLLQKLPLQSLEATMDAFLESVTCLGTEEELVKTREAVTEFLRPDGLGRRLQARLQAIAEDPSVDNWLSDIYGAALWLKLRDNRPRLNNFFGTHRLSKSPQSPAERAALVTLAAYRYKLSLDDGTVKRTYQNDQPLCMDSVNYLFNTNRTPQIGCDRVDRWPENDYIVVLRRGHVYNVPLRGADGHVLSHSKLKAIFHLIREEAPEEVNMASVLSSSNRDVWARTREELIAASPENAEFFSTVEKSLFVVCLDDGSPQNSTERGASFLLDDNTNRWLDKTVSFIICANGVSATLYEHSAIDGLTVYGLQEAIAAATVEHVEADAAIAPADIQEAASAFTYVPFSATPFLKAQMVILRQEHLALMQPYALHTHDFAGGLGAGYLRRLKLPPRTVFQMVLQVALRWHYGYNPGSLDVVSQAQFLKGRVETFNVQTAEVAAFCAAAADPDSGVDLRDKKRLLAAAVKSHARWVAMVSRGRGWARHVVALKEVLRPGEEEEAAPALYADPVYERTRERKVFTTFGDSGCPELGGCWADRSALWISCEVTEDGARLVVINGEGRGLEFIEHVKAASEVVKELISTPGQEV